MKSTTRAYSLSLIALFAALSAIVGCSSSKKHVDEPATTTTTTTTTSAPSNDSLNLGASSAGRAL